MISKLKEGPDMNFGRLDIAAGELTDIFASKNELRALDAGAYAKMRYPKLIPMMRFWVKRFAAAEFGNVFSMYTKAMGGMMQLCTIVFTPNRGADVPLLLIDIMAFGKKRAAFVEYYDCTKNRPPRAELTAVKKKYASLADYPEKPAWYIGERTDFSLIKGGADEDALCAMLRDSLNAYADVCAAANVRRAENIEGLGAFIERMVKEGNPSSATLKRVLGDRGAEDFFRFAIMPKEYNDSDNITGGN